MTRTAHTASHPGTIARVGHLWTTVLDEARHQRAARAKQRQLRAELSTYRTSTDISDLLAAVDGSGSHERDVAQIRTILAHNLADYHRTHVAS